MTFFYDLNKKLDAIREKPETTHKQLNERDMSRAAKGYEKYGKEGMQALAKAGREGKALDPIRAKYDKYDESMEEGSTGDYSAKKARAGKDIGKPGKQFAQIAKSAGERYGSKERGEKVAGAVLAKLRGKNESVAEEYGPMEGEGGVPMTPKQKSFAKLAPPADKITFADKIAGAKKEVDEMLGDVAAEAMKGALRGGQKKLDRNHNGRLDAQDFAMLRAGKGKQETDEGWDDMLKDVEKRRQMKPGDKIQGAKGEIEKTATGVKHTRRYDPKSGETDTGDDTAPAGEKRGRGRPKGSGKAIGAKGPSGKSKLLAREDDHDSNEVKQAMAVLKKAGYKISKGEQELDEKAVSQNQAIAARIARGVQKGEVKAKKGSASAEMAKMEPKELKKFAKTDTKGLPKKKGKEEVEETAAEAPKASKGGMQFGKGIYDSMNRELEQMIAESMNISMSMNNDQHGGPSKSLTVTATDEDAMMLGKLLKMAGVGGGEQAAGSCGSPAEQVDENQPDWPTDTETSNDALQYAGGLNKPKTTVAGDGQTTVPVTAVQVREDEEQGMAEGMMKNFFVILDDSLIDQISNMDGAEVDPDAGTVETWNENTAKQLAAFAQKNPNRLQRKQSMNTAGIRPMAQRVSGSGTGPEYGLKEQGVAEGSLDEQEQVMAPESQESELDEELQRMREMAGIREAAKPDYIDLDRDGNKKESMKKAAADKDKEKKVEESILSMTNLWKAYKG